MIKNVRVELVFTILFLLIGSLGVNVYLITNPTIKTEIKYKNITTPCPDCDCRLEVLEAKMDCNVQEKETTEPEIDYCEIESNKPQWCPGERCPDSQYCNIKPNALNGNCVDRQCI